MQINLEELFYVQDDVQLNPELPSRKIEIQNNEYAMTPEGIKIELHFHKTSETEVLLRGNLFFGWQLICDRCMAEVNYPMAIAFSRDIILPEDGVMLDLEELIREEAILNFPQKTLCKEDCMGICPDCGKNRNENACECQQSNKVDIRLAGLKELFENNFKEV